MTKCRVVWTLAGLQWPEAFPIQDCPSYRQPSLLLGVFNAYVRFCLSYKPYYIVPAVYGTSAILRDANITLFIFRDQHETISFLSILKPLARPSRNAKGIRRGLHRV